MGRYLDRYASRHCIKFFTMKGYPMASTRVYLRLVYPTTTMYERERSFTSTTTFQVYNPILILEPPIFCSLLQLLLMSPCPANPNPIRCLHADINHFCWLTTIWIYQYLYVHSYVLYNPTSYQGLGQKTDKQTIAVNVAICKATDENSSCSVGLIRVLEDADFQCTL